MINNPIVEEGIVFYMPGEVFSPGFFIQKIKEVKL